MSNLNASELYQSFKRRLDIYTSEEVELCQSFKRQLDSSVNLFKQTNSAVEKQEKELMILKQKTVNARESYNIQMKKCQETLIKIKNEIAFEREVLREERRARNKYLLRSKQVSETVNNMDELQCQELAVLDDHKPANDNTLKK